MNNKTINFNCGQLIQLIGKTINFLEALIAQSSANVLILLLLSYLYTNPNRKLY